MAKMNRLSLMKLHGYVAVFFLPLALVFVVSGTLHLFEVYGSSEVTRFSVPVQDWPQTSDDAEKIMSAALEEAGLAVPGGMVPASVIKSRSGDYFWLGLRSTAHLSLKNNPLAPYLHVEMVHQKYDLARSLMQIHRGQGGQILRIMAFAFGIFLGGILLTGVVLSFRTPTMRRQTYWILGSSVGLISVAWAIS